MKIRCYNKNSKNYKNYGGRGIIICEECLKYETFYEWAKNNGYKENLTIDRIDVNGNYEPQNCRWATLKEQANNKRNNLFFTINGITKTQAQWCKEYNIPVTNVRRRLNSGWSIEKALMTPIRKWK